MTPTPIRTILFFDLDACCAAEIRNYDRSQNPEQRWKAFVHGKSRWFPTRTDALAYVTHELGEQE